MIRRGFASPHAKRKAAPKDTPANLPGYAPRQNVRSLIRVILAIKHAITAFVSTNANPMRIVPKMNCAIPKLGYASNAAHPIPVPKAKFAAMKDFASQGNVPCYPHAMTTKSAIQPINA